MSEAVGMNAGVVFVGGHREIVVTSDHLNWYHWSCPLSEIVGLHVDDGLLAVVGDDQVAVSEIQHKGKIWQVVDLKGATCVYVHCSKMFVGTSEGQMFEFEVKRDRSLAQRLGLSKASPAIVPVGEWKTTPGYTLDGISVGGGRNESK